MSSLKSSTNPQRLELAFSGWCPARSRSRASWPRLGSVGHDPVLGDTRKRGLNALFTPFVRDSTLWPVLLVVIGIVLLPVIAFVWRVLRQVLRGYDGDNESA